MTIQGDGVVLGEVIRIIETVKGIVANDMLARGNYREHHLSRPDLVDAPCGGHRVCAVGSLWAAARVPVDRATGSWPRIAYANQRHLTFDAFPALGEAYEALNAAAERYVETEASEEIVQDYERSTDDGDWESELERLFEETTIESDQIQRVLDIALEAVRKS